MRIVFFGTPEFAVPSLKGLAAAFPPVAVVTQPDRLRGRGLKRVEAPPVADAAKRLGIPVLQPATPAEPGFLRSIRGLSPDVFAVAAYGRLLPDSLLGVARHGAINVHPSLLPRWRGPAPVHRTIHAGDAESGVAIMKLVAEMDAGPIAAVERIAVQPRETRGELERRLAQLGAGMLTESLERLGRGDLSWTGQSLTGITYAKMFDAEEREIRWTDPAEAIDRLVRALLPSPAAHFTHGGRRVKVLEAEPAPSELTGGPPGTLLERDGAGRWRVACGSGSLWIGRVQPEGGAAMSSDAWAAGRRLKAGDSL